MYKLADGGDQCSRPSIVYEASLEQADLASFDQPCPLVEALARSTASLTIIREAWMGLSTSRRGGDSRVRNPYSQGARRLGQSRVYRRLSLAVRYGFVR